MLENVLAIAIFTFFIEPKLVVDWGSLQRHEKYPATYSY
ncbi:hypothetical protein M2408_004208 [Sphingobacterium sp. BIGb0165]|nr:hypothetical protein [Sphingobacterium sp. BIGb0165]